MHFLVFDWAWDVLKRAKSVDDKAAIVDAVKTTKLDTIGGPIDFTAAIETEIKPGAGRISANCYKTPLFGNQWRKAAAGSQFPYDATIVSNVAGSDGAEAGRRAEMVYS